MAYTETTTTSYGSRVKSSCAGIGVGIVMFLAGTALLWWNEGRAVKTADMLEEAQEACVDMPKPDKIDRSLDGELVCASAMATTEDSLSDEQFNIGAKAIGLQRSVKYYQWVEHEKTETEDKLGGKEVKTTTYTYTKEWVSSPVESASFHDPAYQNKNMVLTTVDRYEKWAENVSFGAYKLNDGLIGMISSKELLAFALPTEVLKEMEKNTKAAYERFYGPIEKPEAPAAKPAATPAPAVAATPTSDSTAAAQAADSTMTVSADTIPVYEESPYEFIHVAKGAIYYGRTPGSPEVGDVEVTFMEVVPAKVTIVAVADGDTFKPFKAKNKKTFQTLRMGKKSADEIFESENEANSMWTWILRFVGIFLVVMGLRGIFGIIETVLKVVPFVANIVGWGVNLVCTIIGVVWSLIVIAIAWIFYRPLLGITLLVIAGLLIWLFAFKGKDKLKALANKKNATA